MIDPDAAMTAQLAIVGSSANETNIELVPQWRRLGIDAVLLAPRDARLKLRTGDVALGRLDVVPTLDGVEPGLLELLLLERRAGVRVLNRAAALLGAHDKLLTARLLAENGVPHPRTFHLGDGDPLPLEPPLVVKPRFGSWGRDVFGYRSRTELERGLPTLHERSWFRRHGAIVQELLATHGHDLRVLVAGGRVVGAARRVAAPGQWRTNVSLGGSLHSAVPPPEACDLALAAAAAIGADLVGIDLIPLADGGYSVLELNGAADFDGRYSLPDSQVYAEIAAALELTIPASETRDRPRAATR